MNEADLAARVSRALDAVEGNVRAGEEFLGEISSRAELLTILEAVHSQPAWEQAVAARSYRHALGFDKVILVSLIPYGQLRLHIWWPDVPRQLEHVHNHRFSFSSAIVVGRLRNMIFSEEVGSSSGLRQRSYVEDAPLDQQRWRFRASGETAIGEFLSVEMAESSTYTMHAGALHRVEAGAPLTVTVFLETEWTKPFSTVLVEANAMPPAPAAQQRYSVMEIRALLTRLIAALSSEDAG